ncbi:Ubiquitin-associated protein [Gracilaria domingensis]|nr:Ubiquitin-associated protein [Gracilaria domingensis]
MPTVLYRSVSARGSRSLNAPDDDALIKVILDFDAPNHFERPEERNLTNWYKVLNRFDQLLERYISEHDIFKKESNVASKDQTKNLNDSSEHSAQLWSTNSFLTSNDPSQQATLTPGPSSRSTSEKVQAATGAVQASENDGTTETEGSVPLFTPSASCVRLILRQTRELIQNAAHDSRHVYNSVEHLTALLADGHSAIVLLSLEILHLLYQKSGKFRTSRPGFTFELIQRLMEISIGWGGRERGLGLVECCRSNADKPLPNDGKQLHFKYAKSSSGSSSDPLMLERVRWEWSPTIHEPVGRKASNGSGNTRSSSSTPLPLAPSKSLDTVSHGTEPSVSTVGTVTSVVLENVESFNGDERWLLTEFATNHGIPKNKLFSLLYAYRRARAFSHGRVGRIEACILRMYALTILFLLHPMNPSKRDLAKETELLQDVITVARAEAKDGLDDIPLCLRSICIRLLNAFASDRRRFTVVLMVTGLDAHHGSLTTLLRSEIRSIIDGSQNANPSLMDCNMEPQGALQIGRKELETSPSCSENTAKSLTIASECMLLRSRAEQFQVAESLLALVHSLAIPTSSSNAGPFTSSGVLNILLPLLGDRDSSHSRVVTRAIRAMQAILEGSTHSSGTQVFREQNGLTLIADRIAAETDVDKLDQCIDLSDEDEKVEVLALQRRGESREFYNLLREKQMTYAEALEHQPPSSSATSRGQLPHSQWSLLRSLHQLLIPALGSGGNEVRELVANSKLPNALRKIMGQPFHYGGSLFQSAAAVTTNIAHAEPTATVELVDAGIAATVLRSIRAGLPPCGEAIKCIPNLLAALCLAPKARDIVVSLLPLKDFLLRLATPFYTRALHGDIPVHVGNGLDELVRHVEALRESGNEAMEAYIRKSAAFIDNDDQDLRRALNPKGKPEKKMTLAATISESKPASKITCVYGDGTKSPFEQILLDKMKLAVANNTFRLAGLSQNSPEHQERLVKGNGLRDMLRMRKAVAYASAEAAVRDGQNFSRHYPTPSATLASLVVSLRTINSRHPSIVLKALFSVIVEDASRVLRAAKSLGDVWLPEEELAEGKNGSLLQEEEQVDTNKRDVSKHREDLKTNIKILRVDVVVLNGLLRGALGSTTTFWGNCGGAEVTTLLSTVERAARYHLAIAYTGLILSAPDGDLTIAGVTAAANPSMKSLQPSSLTRYIGNVDKLLGNPISRSKGFEEACKKFSVPPQAKTFYRQKVKGMAWQLVTYAVAVQNLYLTLSKGLTLTLRRNARSTVSYAARARSLSATIGRIFVLHLKAAEPLWRVQVATMGTTGIVAAWDYIRGVLIEIKGTVFDEHRRGTQSMILKSFFEAGGFEVLLSVTRPMEIAKVASKGLGDGCELLDIRDSLYRKSVDDPITTSSYILALAEALPFTEAGEQSGSLGRSVAIGIPEGDKSEMELSSDSVTNQAKGIAKIAVSDSNTGQDVPSKSSDEALRALLRDEKALSSLRSQVKNLSSRALAAHVRFSVRKVASDVWNSLCAFLLSLGSCPGLLGTDGPANEGLSTSNDWTKEEIQRTSLTVAMRMLYPVTKENPDLLSVLRQDDSASADFVALIHTASQMAKDLCKRDNSDAIDTNGSGDNHSRPELVADIRIRNTPSPDPSILRALTEMGFPERLARVAIRRTAPGGVEHATEWLVQHLDGDDDSIPSEERNWDGDEQGSGDERDREQTSNPEDEEDESPQAGEGLDSDSNALQLIDDALPVPHTPVDEIMVDAASADPADDSENDNSNGDSSPVPSLSSRDNDDEPRGEVNQKSKPPTSKVKFVTRSVDQDSLDLLKRSAQKDIQLLRGGLRQSPEVKAQDISEIVKFAGKSMGECHSNVDHENGLDPEALKIAPVSVDTFKNIKQDVFESLLEVIKDIVHHAQSGNKDVSFLCVEILSALQKDGILSKQRLDDVARLMKEGLVMSFSSTQNTYAVSRVATLWAHYGGYRGRQSLRNYEVFDLAFKTLRRLVAELETCSKDPNVDEEATQPIKQLSIKEEQSSSNGRSSGSRKRRYMERGSKEAPQSAQVGITASQPRTMSKEEQMLVRRITTCMLLLDARYRYEFKDNIIDISKLDKESRIGKDRKTDGEEDRMEIEDMTGAMDRAISDAHPSKLFEDRGTQNVSTDQLPDGSEDIGGDVNMSSPNGQDLGPKSSMKEIAIVDEELSRIKDLALRTKKAIVDRTKKAMNEVVPKVELEDSERLQRHSVLSICIQCLRIWRNVKVGDSLVATLQLLVSLTRDWDLAKKAYESGIVDNLLALRQLDSRSFHGSEYRVVRALVKTILRHIVEDPRTLQEAMVTEIQTIISQPRARSPSTVKSLLTASAPLLSRNLNCFVSAASQTIKKNDPVQLQAQEQKPASLEYMKEQLPERPNVKEVIWGLAGLLGAKGNRDTSSSKNVVSSATLNRNQELSQFALETLADLIQLFQIAAVAFLSAKSPSSAVQGSALDYVVQACLTSEPSTTFVPRSLSELVSPSESLESPAQRLLHALCSKSANTHREAVHALAAAARIEADKEVVDLEAISGIASCVTSGTKLRVLGAMLSTSLPNDLARSLKKMDTSVSKHFEVTKSVLKALAWLGQAAGTIAKNGDTGNDDMSLPNTGTRPWWEAMSPNHMLE